MAVCLLVSGCIQQTAAEVIDGKLPPIDVPENMPGVTLTVSADSYAEIQSWLGESNSVTLSRAHKIKHSEIGLDLAAGTQVRWDCGATKTLITFSPLPKITSSAIAKLLGLTLTSLQINADGSGLAIVDGFHRGFRWDGRTDSAASAACDCGCGKDGCSCSRGSSSAAPTVSTAARSGQQYVTQTQKQYQCRNGVCGWYDVEVRVPSASAGKRSVAPADLRGIVIYDNGSPAGRAMRQAIGSKGVEWKNGDPPVAINGMRWSPTAIKPDGSTWTPGANGWHGQSAEQFESWRGSQ